VVVKPVISALGMLKQESHKFKVSLGYMVRPCLKQSQKERKKNTKSQLK
jgi:hypothetical protein